MTDKEKLLKLKEKILVVRKYLASQMYYGAATTIDEAVTVIDEAIQDYNGEPCATCQIYTNDFYYCPDCGRKMEGD